MELPPSDAAADIRRTNVEREATYLEFARLEAAAKRRVAQRARVVRDALASTPALAHELERRGVVDDDAALGKLASGLMAAPLSDPPEDTAEVDKTSAHDVADVLREMYGGRRAEHGGIAGELAARRKQLEKRQRDLLRERDRLAEHERVHALTLEERRKVEAAQEEENGRVLRERNARAASGTASSSDSSSSSDDESEYSDANMARAKADARAKAKASTVSPGGKLQRQGGHKGRSRSFKMSQTEKIKAQQDALRPTRVIAPRRVDPNPWDAASESSAASDAAATSPFALPEVPKETLAHGDREALVRRLQKELGVKPTQRVAAFVPTRAKDRLLRMKLAHSSVAARLKYLESAASYEKELRDGEKELRGDATAVVARDVAEYAARLDDTREVSVKTVEQMCRELALEMCGAVTDVLAERPTKEKLAFEKQEWIQRAGPRRLAMCRQTLDDLVREVAREEAMGVVLEVEANHAAAAGFVAKAIAGAVMARLDGDAAAELKPWAPPPPPPAATVGAKEAGKGASGGWLWTSKTPAEKAKAKAAKEKAKAEKMAAAKAKKAARAAAAAAKKAARKNTRWSLFGGSKPKQQTAVPEEDEAIDFHARLNFEEASSSEEYWSTSSSDEDDDFAYDTAVGRHACQHMLNEMQRRRPPGLVFHHTQPLRPASPPPGIARGAMANTNFKETKHAAGGDDADASSSESDSASDSSDSSDSDSDSEAAAEKRRVAAALEKQRRAAEAEAKAKMQPPPRSGVANLGVLAEPPPPSQAHRAALAAERRYWRAVRVAHAFGGKGQRTTIEVKKGAVTSMATAKSGRAQVLAAGTSQGELVVWKFSAPDASSDEEDEAEGLSKKKGKEPSSTPAGNVSSPGKKLSKKAEAAKAAKEAKEKEEAEKEKREKKEIAKPPAVVARAECSFHPEAETQEEDVAVPSAAFGALTSVSWSADASQLCTAERGGSSRMWSLAPTRGTRSGKASGKFAIGETMVLAPVNHATSSPTPDPSPPPPPEKTISQSDSNGAIHSNGDARGHKNVKSKHKQTKEELLEALSDAKEAAREAAKARLRARERWPREAQTLTRFFPAFTLAGRQPFAMFARPNGDIVRASPATRPAAISDASAAPPLSGKIQRELAMFRGAQTWAKGALFKAVERGRRAAGVSAQTNYSDASDSDDGEYGSVHKAGGSTFVPTRRLDNAALYREGAARVGHDDRDLGFVPGSPFVAGVDAVLDVAETFAGGTGEHMGKPERDLLLAPDIAPALPGQSSKKASEASEASKTPYTQDVYRGHTRPVVFLDVLPDSGSLLSVDADGLMCLWSAFQGNAGRGGFGWFSPMGTWRLPAEVTAQVPSGFPVEVSAGAGKFTPSTHAPWIASRVGKLATVFEAPKDDAWIAEDAKAARAIAALSAPRTYGEQLELEPVRRRLDIPGVDPDLETPEQKWRKGQGEVGDLDPARFDARNDANAKNDANANLSFDTKTGVVIPRGETRDYFVSQYDDDGRCVRRLRQLHVTRRAAAPIVGAVIASDGGIPDLVVIRRVSGVCAAALKAGGADAALASAPYFTAHTYSLDSMDPTAPRMDMPNPFLPPKGRGALDAKRSRAKPGAALEQAGALAARGWTDPAPYPFALAKSTPATGSEHLVVPTGANHVGVFSIATGAMCRDFALPGVPEKEGHLSAIKVFDSPHPTSCGRGSLTRSLLAVATTNGAKIWVYALDESAAQILGVDSARATIKKAPVPTPRVGRRGRERRVTRAESESESASSDSDSESSDSDSDETSGNARACVRLRGMTTRRALQDAAEARELVRDTREVCSDFGKVVSVFAPRPHPGGDPSLDPAGVGELYLRFDAAAGAAAARAALDGREFDGNVVRASFVSTALFEKTQKRAARAEEKNAPAKYKSSSRARAAEKNER